ncbi:MAG: SMC-Scp complex subunit ScpB [bacterium]
MKREVEALLFATDAPLSVQRLRSLFPDASAKELRDLLKELETEYEEAGHAFTIVEFGGGWQIATRPDYAKLVSKLFRGRRFTRLSKPGLEVLSIVAYRQPVTRLEIEDVRGTQSSGVLSTLQERNLVKIVGRADTVGHPLLYGTTREFLNYLGLKGLAQLPSLPSLEGVINDRDELRQFAQQLSEEINESDLEKFEHGGEEEPPSPDNESATEDWFMNETAEMAESPDVDSTEEMDSSPPPSPAATDLQEDETTGQ